MTVTEREYTTIAHPGSGETYAVRLHPDGSLRWAAGPLHHNEPTDPDSIQDYLGNQWTVDMERNAKWLAMEIDLDEGTQINSPASMFKLEFETDNAAFGEEDDRLHEIAFILENIASDVQSGKQGDTVLDVNGNSIGKWSLT